MLRTVLDFLGKAQSNWNTADKADWEQGRLIELNAIVRCLLLRGAWRVFCHCGAVGIASFDIDFSHVIQWSDMLAWCIISIMWEDWGNSVEWLYFSTVSVKGRLSVSHRLEKASSVLLLCETEILNVTVSRPMPPFSGTSLHWAVTDLTCAEHKYKSAFHSGVSPYHSSSVPEMRRNNDRKTSVTAWGELPCQLNNLNGLVAIKLAFYRPTRHEFRRLQWLYRKV